MTLKELRRQAGLTQRQLARLADLDQGGISRLERGGVPSPDYRTLMKLAIALKSYPDVIAESIRQSVVEAA